MQLEHELAPGGEYVPGPHGKHVEAPELEYVPVPHTEQVEARAAEYLPASHIKQEPAAYFPAAHGPPQSAVVHAFHFQMYDEYEYVI